MLAPGGCQSNLACRYYPIDDDARSRFPDFEVKQSGREIKVKLRNAVTGLFTAAGNCRLRGPESFRLRVHINLADNANHTRWAAMPLHLMHIAPSFDSA